jgi:hypothetical protein
MESGSRRKSPKRTAERRELLECGNRGDSLGRNCRRTRVTNFRVKTALQASVFVLEPTYWERVTFRRLGPVIPSKPRGPFALVKTGSGDRGNPTAPRRTPIRPGRVPGRRARRLTRTGNSTVARYRGMSEKPRNSTESGRGHDVQPAGPGFGVRLLVKPLFAHEAIVADVVDDLPALSRGIRLSAKDEAHGYASQVPIPSQA